MLYTNPVVHGLLVHFSTKFHTSSQNDLLFVMMYIIIHLLIRQDIFAVRPVRGPMPRVGGWAQGDWNQGGWSHTIVENRRRRLLADKKVGEMKPCVVLLYKQLLDEAEHDNKNY